MKKIAIITLSLQGAEIAAALTSPNLTGFKNLSGFSFNEASLYVHQEVQTTQPAYRFTRVIELTAQIFHDYQGIIYIMPTGVVIRALSAHVRDKLQDPAVVVVDVGGRWAISLLSGHEGGANDLAMQVANIIGVEPIITTTTDAIRRLIVGIGCRRGMSAERLIAAIQDALSLIKRPLEEVRLFATAEPKQDEVGLLQAAAQLQRPLRVIKADEIRTCYRDFQVSHFVQTQVNLPAVAEPAALLAGRNTQLILKKQTFNGITIAIAEENCMWLASAPAAP
ncbi:MAG: cobalamin biosynthesis protein CbiG [Candidatus Parabeggiatoa sp. nov. 3]|jgi:cobalt-precorrin 5A hydrolase|nr:MAG: cobalamin biosynthesis protein CbiG [Gammaproteobacteria bacterium]HEW97037.1 cobalamin biosynthesis protein CbiG [Beggiatoa sp.]